MNLIFILFTFTMFALNCCTKIGPLDIVIVMDESESMRQHLTQYSTKIRDNIYTNFINFVTSSFDIGTKADQTRVAVLCSGYWDNPQSYLEQSYNLHTVHQHGKCAKAGKSITVRTYWTSYDVNIPLTLAENLHSGFSHASNKLLIKGGRPNVQKLVIVFTDGILSDEEAQLVPCAANLLNNNNSKLFFFHLNDKKNLKETTRTAYVKSAKNQDNVIQYDVNKQENSRKIFLDAICEYKNSNDTSCRATPDDKTRKCRKNFTGLGVAGCYKSLWKKCDESECDCDEMYPWPAEPVINCTTTCGPGLMVYERKVNQGSLCNVTKVEKCPTEFPCPTSESVTQFDEIEQVYNETLMVLFDNSTKQTSSCRNSYLSMYAVIFVFLHFLTMLG